jgi:hypothetical protein
MIAEVLTAVMIAVMIAKVIVTPAEVIAEIAAGPRPDEWMAATTAAEGYRP